MLYSKHLPVYSIKWSSQVYNPIYTRAFRFYQKYPEVQFYKHDRFIPSKKEFLPKYGISLLLIGYSTLAAKYSPLKVASEKYLFMLTEKRPWSYDSALFQKLKAPCITKYGVTAYWKTFRSCVVLYDYWTARPLQKRCVKL